MTAQPTVGRIVHYVSHGTPTRADGTQAYTALCRAAVVTETCAVVEGEPGPCVSLAVLNPTGMFFNQHIVYGPQADWVEGDGTHEGYPPGSWHWPERA